MRNRLLIVIVIAILIIGLFLYLVCSKNRKLKTLENEVCNIEMPQDIEKVAIKSAIGDSGGNGDYSTYRVVLVVKTEMSINELNKEFENRNLTFSSHIVNSGTPICYITKCEDNVFKSQRDFTLTFDELEKVEDFMDYYFIDANVCCIFYIISFLSNFY